GDVDASARRPRIASRRAVDEGPESHGRGDLRRGRVVVEDPLARIAVDDLAALLEGLHRRRPHFHVTGGARSAGHARNREAVLRVDESTELGAVARRNLGLELRDLFARAGELLVDRPLLGAPVLEALLVLLGLGRKRLLALGELGARLLDLILEVEE